MRRTLKFAILIVAISIFRVYPPRFVRVINKEKRYFFKHSKLFFFSK